MHDCYVCNLSFVLTSGILFLLDYISPDVETIGRCQSRTMVNFFHFYPHGLCRETYNIMLVLFRMKLANVTEVPVLVVQIFLGLFDTYGLGIMFHELMSSGFAVWDCQQEILVLSIRGYCVMENVYRGSVDSCYFNKLTAENYNRNLVELYCKNEQQAGIIRFMFKKGPFLQDPVKEGFCWVLVERKGQNHVNYLGQQWSNNVEHLEYLGLLERLQVERENCFRLRDICFPFGRHDCTFL